MAGVGAGKGVKGVRRVIAQTCRLKGLAFSGHQAHEVAQGRRPHPQPQGQRDRRLAVARAQELRRSVEVFDGKRFARHATMIAHGPRGQSTIRACLVAQFAPAGRAQVLGRVTPRWPWYLPPRSLYEVSQTSSLSKNSTWAQPSPA